MLEEDTLGGPAQRVQVTILGLAASGYLLAADASGQHFELHPDGNRCDWYLQNLLHAAQSILCRHSRCCSSRQGTCCSGCSDTCWHLCQGIYLQHDHLIPVNLCTAGPSVHRLSNFTCITCLDWTPDIQGLLADWGQSCTGAYCGPCSRSLASGANTSRSDHALGVAGRILCRQNVNVTSTL